MNILRYITGIFIFALVTAIIYVWGMKKSLNQAETLSDMLYKEAERKLIKHLKKNKTADNKDVENLVSGIKAQFFYSKNKAKVNDVKVFSASLLKKLEDENKIIKTGNMYALKE